VIFCLLPDYASLFSSPLSVFVRRGRCFDAIVGSMPANARKSVDDMRQ